MTLFEGVIAGETRATARALTLVEDGGDGAYQLLKSLRGRVGRARTVGFTGAPGVGKSTLVEAVGVELLARGAKVAVLAVDPTSPYSGGALLGDRVRMPELVDGGGFVRSMATRGALGGLAVAVADAIDVLDASGYDWVLVETVGVGQDEVEVAHTVDTVVVVTVPGLGDDIQAAKAGILEIADVFAVNMADRPGVELQEAALAGMLDLQPCDCWRPPIVRTVAISRQGAANLVDSIEAHRRHQEKGDRRGQRRRQQAGARVQRILAVLVDEQVRTSLADSLSSVLDDVGSGALDVRSAAERLFAGLFGEEQ